MINYRPYRSFDIVRLDLTDIERIIQASRSPEESISILDFQARGQDAVVTFAIRNPDGKIENRISHIRDGELIATVRSPRKK